MLKHIFKTENNYLSVFSDTNTVNLVYGNDNEHRLKLFTYPNPIHQTVINFCYKEPPQISVPFQYTIPDYLKIMPVINQMPLDLRIELNKKNEISDSMYKYLFHALVLTELKPDKLINYMIVPMKNDVSKKKFLDIANNHIFWVYCADKINKLFYPEFVRITKDTVKEIRLLEPVKTLTHITESGIMEYATEIEV